MLYFHYKAEATAFPPDDVALPPKAIFEVRMIVWKAKNVVCMDSFGGMNDTYVKAFIEGTDSQSTDIHWRAKKGKASWNWRMKFDVELGHNTRTMKFPYLNLSMWDKDILKYDDVIAETVLDLGKYFKRAYKKGKAVKLFDDAKKTGKKKKKKPPPPTKTEEEEAEKWKFEEPSDKPPPPSLDAAPPTSPKKETTTATPTAAGTGDEKMGDLLEEEVANQATEDDLMSAPEPDVEAGNKEVELTDSTTNPLHPKDETPVENQPTTEGDDEESGGGGGGCCGCFGAKKEVESDSEDAPLLSAEEQEKADDDKEATATISTIKGLFGLGEDDPPDSTWLHMTIKDFKNDERIPMGKLCISVNILPKAEAKISENGFGRRDPNHTPVLPPPVGRLKFSLNPFVMGKCTFTQKTKLSFFFFKFFNFLF